MTPSEPFFRSISLTDVTLRVRDLPRTLAFYRDVLGLRVVSETNTRAILSADGHEPALIVLEHAPTASLAPPGAAGLFHIAILYPDRAALGRALRHIAEAGVRPGSGDHGVSEALYFEDPEGNGLELYADRPVSAWPTAQPDGQVTMYTRAVDLASVLAGGDRAPGPLMPAATRIGHLHLRVSDLARAEAFYSGVLGFPIRQRSYPGALFFGRDGYHHHVAANTWRSHAPAAPGALGLARWTLRFTRETDFTAALSAAGAARPAVAETDSRSTATALTTPAVRLRNADGLEIILQLSPVSIAAAPGSPSANH